MSCWNALRMNITRSVGLTDKTSASGARDSRLESLADQSDCLSVLYSYLCLFDTGNQFLGTTSSENHAGRGKKLLCSLAPSYFGLSMDKERTRERIAFDVSPYSPVNGRWKPGQYTQPGSSWRPSTCQADVIATRPWVPCQSVSMAHVVSRCFASIHIRSHLASGERLALDLLGDIGSWSQRSAQAQVRGQARGTCYR